MATKEVVVAQMRFPNQHLRVNEKRHLVFGPRKALTDERADADPIEIEVTRLGDDCYRLDDPWIGSYGIECASFMDVVLAEELPDGTLLFKAVKEPGNWKIENWVLGPDFIESAEMQPVFEKMTLEGGFLAHDPWMGGILWIFSPPNANYDPGEDIKSAHKLWDATESGRAFKKKMEDLNERYKRSKQEKPQ
jgi:hypothetical protein